MNEQRLSKGEVVRAGDVAKGSQEEEAWGGVS